MIRLSVDPCESAQALHVTVMERKPVREFFLAEAYWLPPDGDQIRCSFRKFEGPCARSGEMLTTTITASRGTACRARRIDSISVIAASTSGPRLQTRGAVPHTSARRRAISALSVAA